MGYRATTLDTIAARAGISKVTLYRYVPGKEELLCRVFERTAEASRSGLRRIVEQDLPVDEKLRRIIAFQVALLANQAPFLTVFFGEESGLPPAMARRVVREKRAHDEAIGRVVQQGIEAGRFRPIDARLLVFAIDGMCNWMTKWYRPQGALRPEDIAAVFVDLLEHGYLVRPAAPADGEVGPALRRIEARLARLERRHG